MRSYAPAGSSDAFHDRFDVRMFLRHVFAVADVEVRKLRRDPVELFTRAVQPILWLAVFGQVMAGIRGVPTGRLGYLDFMAPGILAQSVLFIAIFYGISTIWERDLGIVHKYLVSPASRTALVLGKALSAGIRALAQASIVYLMALLMRIHTDSEPAHVLGVLILIVISGALFSTVSLIMACLMRSRERFMGVGQVMTMPLFFASNAIYPIVLMPGWLQGVSAMNPLTYEVDGLRALMVRGGASTLGLGLDFGVLLAVTALLVAVAARLYPRLGT